MQIEQISGALGAEIHGVDLRQGLSDAQARELRQALLDHVVIFFREQDIDLDAFRNFARAFGQPVRYPLVRGVDGYPDIIEVLKRENERTNFGGIWHSDTAYLQEPPMGTVLLAHEVPPYGGDTMWANQYLAYEALSDGLKRTLDGLKAVYTSAKADASKTREDRIRDSGVRAAIPNMVTEHPVVRTHPETGRKSLFVNVAHTARFVGWTEEESLPLLRFLFRHQIRPEFTCRFRWEKNSIAFWDNRAALHNPVNDYHGFRRSMYRITLAGDRPY